MRAHQCGSSLAASSLSSNLQTIRTPPLVVLQGSSLLFTDKECMAQHADDCFQPDDDFYRLVTNGLDQSLKQFFESIEGILMATPDEIHTENEAFNYVWEVGMGHIVGGLIKLTDVYSSYVVVSQRPTWP